VVQEGDRVVKRRAEDESKGVKAQITSGGKGVVVHSCLPLPLPCTASWTLMHAHLQHLFIAGYAGLPLALCVGQHFLFLLFLRSVSTASASVELVWFSVYEPRYVQLR